MNNEQPELPLVGFRLKEEGMALAAAHADAAWKPRFIAAIEDLANNGDEFTCDDATAVVGPPPSGTHPNAVGAIFAATVRRLKCEYRGTAFSRRAARHAARLGRWQLWQF